MKQCCVIGGCGFIGRHLIELLQESGRDVVVIDRLPPAAANLKKTTRYLCNRVSDKAFLAKALRNADEVVDLAYATVPKTSFDNPITDITSNLPFGVDLFQAVSSSRMRKLVILSSGGTVYGEALKSPIRETHATNPISPYGITKLAVEKYALMFHHLNDLPVVILRPGNAYGEGQKAFSGQGFIATAMASFIQGKPVTIFGRNGTIRDYIHVNDIVSGVVAALDKGRAGSCYNLGTGKGRSNRQVLNAIIPLARRAGLLPKILTEPRRKFDVSCNILNSSRMQQETGWKHAVLFDEGISRMWDWCLRNYSY